jgi:hypothetical protein
MAQIIQGGFPNHFPLKKVFEVTDAHNGKRRGTWYYRSPLHGDLRGPFATELIAKINYNHDAELMEN